MFLYAYCVSIIVCVVSGAMKVKEKEIEGLKWKKKRVEGGFGKLKRI